ncbi:AAA family ATPase [Caenimonas aquaedulcis]|uniref:AAA family ATPase n=1 Tax=Caenimonas aquaedulcis TaxID=2793270 RepID=A0A931H4U3_9BURK|nr:AAA family ATPase [Caenimonas aquaedulcis]MBG9388512.1 AAA family ATPase [Caenimonas aquaedulcis]
MTVNPTGNRFCESCGGQLQRACPSCGHDVSPGARFCGACGSSMETAAATASESVPKWGELKQATVLFADIVGSTELIAGMGPEEAMGRLRPAVLRMRHSVERFGGTVVRTLGDGVMALFGVPHTLEGHALLACQAALHMQKVFARDAHGPQIRVGLHSGEIASDPQDARDGQGGGAHGLTIHIASRVVALADPGGVCMTQTCRLLAGNACKTRCIGVHPLKGIRDPVELHELLRMELSGAMEQGARSGTFRGRARELARLVRAIDALDTGGANAIGIAGDSGAGKSRLCHEFAQLCRGRGVPVFEVRAQLYGHALPLQPILELFRTHFFGIAAADDAQAARDRIQARFQPLDPARADLELLFEFFGVGASGADAGIGAHARQARLLALLKALVRHDAAVTRVILIEDLHWLDDASEEFVSALIEAVGGTRTVLLLNYRPSYRCPWLGVAHFEQMELHELSGDEMQALVAELMTPVSTLPDLWRLVCRRAGGNPFFAEELVRAIAESNLLSTETGLPLEGLAAVERALPATVQAVVGARLDRLGEPEKTLLLMCAIIGKEIPLSVLEHVASPLASQIEKGLNGLLEAGLILPQPAEGGRRFAFRHPLIQEVAYNGQLKVRRGQLHSAVAEAMELYYAPRLDEFAGLIAYHFEAAKRHLDAARYTARAANWIASTDSARATGSWRKVRELLRTVEASAEVDSLKVLACGKIAWLSWRDGLPMPEVMRFIEEAREIAGQHDARILGLLLFLEGRMLQANGGSVDRYVELVQQARALLGPDATPGSRVLLDTALCQGYGWAGMFGKALAASDAALGGAQAADSFEEAFIGFSLRQWTLVLRGRLLIRMGQLDAAAQCLREVTCMDEQSVDPILMQIAHFGQAEAACLAGDGDAAERHARAVQQIAQRQGNAYLHVFAHACRALVDHAQDRYEVAISGFRRALDLVRRDNVAREFETELLACLAECCYATDDLEAAEALCGEVMDLSHQRKNRHQHVRALVIASAVRNARGDESAHELLARARELVRATEAGPLAFRVKALPEIVLH